MPRPTNDVDRKLALRAYRKMRRAGLAPIAAAEKLCGELSDHLAWHLDAGNERTADHVLATWRAANEYRVSIALRLDELPYWQTGKVTPPIMQYAHIESDRGTASDEAQTGECWTCEQGFTRRSNLIGHVALVHGRRPFDAVPYTANAS